MQQGVGKRGNGGIFPFFPFPVCVLLQARNAPKVRVSLNQEIFAGETKQEVGRDERGGGGL